MGGPNVVASWLAVSNLSHDIALVPEPTPARGRFHHVALHYTIAVQHLFDLAELAREAGIRIETAPAATASAAPPSSTSSSRAATASS